MEKAARIEANLRRVRERISEAAAQSGRSAEAVKLVAVTKAVGVEEARILLDLGVRDLGENRVQGALVKNGEISCEGLRWHMIGHLQRRKAAHAAELFSLIHSVDSVRLADALDRRAQSAGRVVRVLLQVNASMEPQKHGVDVDEAESALRAMSALAHIEVRGFMTMAQIADRAEETRPVFARLAELACRLRELRIARVALEELSMGMTQDFEVAIEEGATMVRIGSALYEGTQR